MPYPQNVPEVKETVSIVRDEVGPDVDIMIDPASRWKLPEAKHILSELEEFNPLFAEDFVGSYKHTNPNEIEKLADSTHIPIALGDKLYRLPQFEELITRDAAGVLQPNITYTGGILEVKKIAAAAEHHGIRIAPQNALGPVATAAAVHVDFTIPNFLIQEIAGTDFYGGWDTDLINTDVLEIENGYIFAPEKPGLGIEISDEAFESPPAVSETPLYLNDESLIHPDWSPRTDHGR